MKIGLIPCNVGVTNVDMMIKMAQTAEEVGLESIWTFEHALVPENYESAYPYSADGKMGATPETNFVDPLIALSAIAQHTKKLRLGTGVNILPQSNPLMLAKQAASLDFVSGGRFMLGIGIGWLKEEFEALGVPFERRGARFADYVEAMRKVWSGDTVEHESDFIKWTGFKSYPVPVQSPLPLIIGGSKKNALKRVARYGQGWYAPAASADQVAALLPALDEACAAEGRDRSTIEISTMYIPVMEPVEEALPRYRDLGVERLIIPLQALGEKPMEGLARLGDDVLAKIN
ncbi:MAG: LLM class F420-dependent oxidoreductase [Candidatus Binatia bacterium]|nr:LLM class F420-dependent oxidoreductase [Candidatus Binatia bacterium]